MAMPPHQYQQHPSAFASTAEMPPPFAEDEDTAMEVVEEQAITDDGALMPVGGPMASLESTLRPTADPLGGKRPAAIIRALGR